MSNARNVVLMVTNPRGRHGRSGGSLAEVELVEKERHQLSVIGKATRVMRKWRKGVTITMHSSS